jgi:hypothetical protein
VSICTVDIQRAVREHKSPAFLTGMKALQMPWDDSEDSEDEDEAPLPAPGGQMQPGEWTPPIENNSSWITRKEASSMMAAQSIKTE